MKGKKRPYHRIWYNSNICIYCMSDCHIPFFSSFIFRRVFIFWRVQKGKWNWRKC